MPQAPDELRQKWQSSGDRIDSEPAVEHLISRGYKLNKDWTWDASGVIGEPTEEDNSAIDYMWLEWDFGGIVQVVS